VLDKKAIKQSPNNLLNGTKAICFFSTESKTRKLRFYSLRKNQIESIGMARWSNGSYMHVTTLHMHCMQLRVRYDTVIALRRASCSILGESALFLNEYFWNYNKQPKNQRIAWHGMAWHGIFIVSSRGLEDESIASMHAETNW